MLPFTVWTHKELSAQAKRIGIGISSSYYGILKKKGLKPHKSEYWLFPKIENEEEFVARIEKLNELYAIANCPTNEIVISSPDEKTGIQAISHSQISKMEIGKPKRIEYQVEIDYSPGKSSLKLAIARFWS